MFLHNFVNLIYICLIIGQNINEIQSKSSDNWQNFGVRFRSVKCEADNKTIVVLHCYLKPVSRKIVTFNLKVKFLVPYKKPIYDQLIIYYRYGNIYREIIDTHQHELCSVIDGANANPLFKVVINMLKSVAPDLVHKCPYTGELDLKNFTMNISLLDTATMMFPSGIYRVDVQTIFNGSSAFNLSVVVESKSPLNENFG